MKRVGIGGVIWMEVSGPVWAPQGTVTAARRDWHEAIQWAISEADRLGLTFKAGRTLRYVHVDSWEAGGPNQTMGFAEAFRNARAHPIQP